MTDIPASEVRGLHNRRLILHCGVQKTATTSLQRFLRRNAQALAPDLTVLTPERGSSERELGHAAMQFSLDPAPRVELRFTAAITALRQSLDQGDGPLLISHENLPGAMIGKAGVVTLYPMLERILDLLESGLAPWRPEYVFYTRDMAAWKRSVYAQAVRTDRYAGPLAQFMDETAGCGGWDGLQARLDARLGSERVRFFRLEDEPDPGRPGAQLLAFAGLTAERIVALDPVRRRNQSLLPSAVEFLRQVNGLDLDTGTRSRLVDLVATNQSLFSKREAVLK
jgi:hypothetical protein